MKEHIDEMTKVLVDYTEKNHIMASHVILEEYAKQLYNADYRKQKWISVDERLPEREGKYLVYTYKGGIKFGEYRSYLVGEGKMCEPQFDYYVTHWMELPEAPKMKCGAECTSCAHFVGCETACGGRICDEYKEKKDET